MRITAKKVMFLGLILLFSIGNVCFVFLSFCVIFILHRLEIIVLNDPKHVRVLATKDHSFGALFDDGQDLRQPVWISHQCWNIIAGAC